MALPALTDQTVSTWARIDVPTPSVPSSLTSYKAPQTSQAGSTTCNLATDTLIFRADNALWDDTNQCWINIDQIGFPATPKK